MSLTAWEEPAEDLTEHPAVIYDEGRPVCWLNHAPSDLMADPEWTLHHPTPADDGAYTHIFTNVSSSAWWTPPATPADPLGDVRKAWDMLVDDYLNGTLRGR